MRTFLITKNGVARVMRTYALAPSGRVITDPTDDTLAPDAVNEIAKWHSQHQSEVTNIREIAEGDIPDTEFKDAWRDNGVSIDIDMPAARLIHASRIAQAVVSGIDRLRKEEVVASFQGRVADASRHAAEKATVEGINIAAEVGKMASAQDPTTLSAIWPVGLARV